MARQITKEELNEIIDGFAGVLAVMVDSKDKKVRMEGAMIIAMGLSIIKGGVFND